MQSVLGKLDLMDQGYSLLPASDRAEEIDIRLALSVARQTVHPTPIQGHTKTPSIGPSPGDHVHVLADEGEREAGASDFACHVRLTTGPGLDLREPASIQTHSGIGFLIVAWANRPQHLLCCLVDPVVHQPGREVHIHHPEVIV